MGQFVKPKVFLVGYSQIHAEGLLEYLKYTNQEDFADDWANAKKQGLSDAECLCSCFAKLCYKSLVVGKNENISKIRDVPSNIRGCFDQGHGSVFENASINFIGTDVSRVFTHELVRMRAGWAYAQTSGRFCRLDHIDLVKDPILDDCDDLLEKAVTHTEEIVYLLECRKKLRIPPPNHGNCKPYTCLMNTVDLMKYWISSGRSSTQYDYETVRQETRWIPDPELEKPEKMGYKKKVTSAIRRIAPNGQSNEIGFSVNLRALRHFVMLRSARHAEWEIRLVVEQVYKLLNKRFPLLFYGAKVQEVEGILEISGMKTQPYEIDLTKGDGLKYFTDEQLQSEMIARTLA